jgi:UDP-N-acetylglucosamine--N-acetylmuramyl-(pentapeptide) pyrophosphoryl-undecaprenol N-acetylglucosamine transferase
MKILFYAINHVGLGHVVRMSVLQRFIARHTTADCYFFSESRHAGSFFSCPGLIADVAPSCALAERGRLLVGGLQRALDAFQPDILVCDTYWSAAAPLIPSLRRRGVRSVLVLRMTDHKLMQARVRWARPSFDTILIPHHPDEVRAAYRNHRRLLQELDSPQFALIGPICRSQRQSPETGEVIFTVGAGGEWPEASKANQIDTFVTSYVEASRLLRSHGYPKPKLAPGTFLGINDKIRESFDLYRTSSLYQHFGPNTTVVTRGGYNTVWESIAARSLLVVCGTRNRLDDIKARSRFVKSEGIGRSVRPEGRMLFDAIVGSWDSRERASVERWASIVNAGLPLAFDEMTGGRFLRAKERSVAYEAKRISTMSRKHDRLIARFEGVDPVRTTPVLQAAVRIALQLRYDIQLRLLKPAMSPTGPSLRALVREGAEVLPDRPGKMEADCVSVLVWPGPRVRNELRISEELAGRRSRGVRTGLDIDADRIPLFVTEYLLRLFSLYNH